MASRFGSAVVKIENSSGDGNGHDDGHSDGHEHGGTRLTATTSVGDYNGNSYDPVQSLPAGSGQLDGGVVTRLRLRYEPPNVASILATGQES